MENQPGLQQSDWRRMSRGLLYNLKYVLMNGIMTDLTIRLINGEDIWEYKVHKFVFQLASEVFERMLNSDFKEGLSSTIEIEDVTPDTFQLFLNHLYGQPLVINDLEQALSLLELADYYLIHSLKDDVINFCQTTCTPEFACIGLEVSGKYKAPMLRKAKLQYISKNTKEVVESTNFLKLSLRAMKNILEQDRISIREIDLFEAVREWILHNLAAKGESIKEILIPMLRYSSMSLSEFIGGPVASELVEGSDLASLMQSFFTKNSLVPLPAGFSEAKRIYWNQLTTESLELLEYDRDECYYILVSANKSVTLTHFFIYPAMIDDEVEYKEYVKIIQDNTVIGSFKGVVNVVDKIEIKLDQKLHLKKGRLYKLEIRTSLNERNVVDLTDKSITCDNISFTFYKGDFPLTPYSVCNPNPGNSTAPLHSILFEC